MTSAERFEAWLASRPIVKNFGGRRAALEGWKAAKEDEKRRAEAEAKQKREAQSE